MSELLTAFSTYFPWVILFIVALVFRRSIKMLFQATCARISSSEGFEVTITPWFKVMTTNTNTARQREEHAGGELKAVGNPDQLKLLFKAQSFDKSQLTGWVKSTKALDVPGGCLVQMTSEHLGRNGSWTSSQSLQFVPGVRTVPTKNDVYILEAMQDDIR